MTWKCNPVWSGSWPQSCHSGMVCTQLLSRFSLLNWPPWLWWTRDTSIWPLTASEGDYLYIYMRWKCNLVWSGGFGLNHVIVVWFVPSCYPGSASSTPLHGFDGIRIHPYHYQMHQKVVKHFIYVPWTCNPVWSGSWPQSWHIGMVCTQLFSRFSLLNPPPWLWWTRDTFIWPSTELEGSSTLYIYMRWKCNPVWSGGFRPQPCHSGIVCT